MKRTNLWYLWGFVDVWDLFDVEGIVSEDVLSVLDLERVPLVFEVVAKVIEIYAL